MERIKRKLHSRRGASILLAMLLMLVATMVCAVIISASLTAAKRVSDDRTQEQASLSIGSAGRLMVQYLEENNQCTQEWSVKKTYDYDGDGNESEPYNTSTTPTPITGPLKNAIEHWDDSSYKNHLVVNAVVDGGKTIIQPAILEFSLRASSDGMRDVVGTLFLVDEVPADLSDLESLKNESPQKLYLKGIMIKEESVSGPRPDYEFYSDGSMKKRWLEYTYTTTWKLLTEDESLRLSTMPWKD